MQRLAQPRPARPRTARAASSVLFHSPSPPSAAISAGRLSVANTSQSRTVPSSDASQRRSTPACRATGGRQSAEEAHQRAQAAQRDTHLVHEFGIVMLEHPALVAEPLRGDVAGQREQRGALRAHAVQVDGLGLDGTSAAGRPRMRDRSRSSIARRRATRRSICAPRQTAHAARRCARAVFPSRRRRRSSTKRRGGSLPRCSVTSSSVISTTTPPSSAQRPRRRSLTRRSADDSGCTLGAGSAAASGATPSTSSAGASAAAAAAARARAAASRRRCPHAPRRTVRAP